VPLGCGVVSAFDEGGGSRPVEEPSPLLRHVVATALLVHEDPHGTRRAGIDEALLGSSPVPASPARFPMAANTPRGDEQRRQDQEDDDEDQLGASTAGERTTAVP